MKCRLRPPFPTLGSSAGRILIGLILCGAAALVSCGQDYNSNSGDAALGSSGIDCTTPAGARLCAAYDAFKHNGCFAAGCHSPWSEFKTDAAWLGSGLVTAASPSTSTLFQKLQLPGGGGGNMPLGRSPMSASEYQAVSDWITGL